MLGFYVIYKENTYLVVKVSSATGLLQLNSIKHPRVQVSSKSVTVANLPNAKLICYKGPIYIVTCKGNIFSSTTGKLMKWSNENVTRKGIMKAYGLKD